MDFAVTATELELRQVIAREGTKLATRRVAPFSGSSRELDPAVGTADLVDRAGQEGDLAVIAAQDLAKLPPSLPALRRGA